MRSTRQKTIAITHTHEHRMKAPFASHRKTTTRISDSMGTDTSFTSFRRPVLPHENHHSRKEVNEVSVHVGRGFAALWGRSFVVGSFLVLWLRGRALHGDDRPKS